MKKVPSQPAKLFGKARVVGKLTFLPGNDIVYSQDHTFGMRGLPAGIEFTVEQFGAKHTILWLRAPGYGIHGNDENGKSLYGSGVLAVMIPHLPKEYRDQLDLDPTWRLEYLDGKRAQDLLKQFWVNYTGGSTVQAAADLYDQLRPYFDTDAPDPTAGT